MEKNIIGLNIPLASFLEKNLQGMQNVGMYIRNLYGINAVMKEDVLFWSVEESRIKNHSRVT